MRLERIRLLEYLLLCLMFLNRWAALKILFLRQISLYLLLLCTKGSTEMSAAISYGEDK